MHPPAPPRRPAAGPPAAPARCRRRRRRRRTRPVAPRATARARRRAARRPGRGRPPRPARGPGPPARRTQPVQLPVAHAEDIARGPIAQAFRGQHRPQPRRVGAQHTDGVPRRVGAPHGCDQPILRHHHARAQQQRRKQRARLRTAQGYRVAVDGDLQRPQDPELHGDPLSRLRVGDRSDRTLTSVGHHRVERTCPRAVKRARHNSYRVKKPGEPASTRHRTPATIKLHRLTHAQHDQLTLRGIDPKGRRRCRSGEFGVGEVGADGFGLAGSDPGSEDGPGQVGSS